MKKTSQVTLKLTDDDFEFLKELAVRTGFSAQALVRQMIAAVRRQWEMFGRVSLPLVLADVASASASAEAAGAASATSTSGAAGTSGATSTSEAGAETRTKTR
ncbi:MAG: hypothetical protein LBR07_07910 [Puniceicoccales bacterium]|jgi:hypothetical protein|nr:hypothetical protein [Puniceicoccales bacterium]